MQELMEERLKWTYGTSYSGLNVRLKFLITRHCHVLGMINNT